MNTYTDDKWKEFMAIDYEPINTDLLEACKVAEKLIRTARRYFPKSIRNSDKFDLENTGATISAAIHRAENEKPK